MKKLFLLSLFAIIIVSCDNTSVSEYCGYYTCIRTEHITDSSFYLNTLWDVETTLETDTFKVEAEIVDSFFVFNEINDEWVGMPCMTIRDGKLVFVDGEGGYRVRGEYCSGHLYHDLKYNKNKISWNQEYHAMRQDDRDRYVYHAIETYTLIRIKEQE